MLPLPGLYYLRVIATEQAEPLLQQGLRDVAAYMARQVEGAPASLNVSFDICMASATYAPTLGLAESVRLTSGSKEPGLVAELRSLGCKSTTMPPAINWSQELANLRQEIADPLVPVHPDLPGLATRHTPPDDQDAHEDQHLHASCAVGMQTLPASAPRLRDSWLGRPFCNGSPLCRTVFHCSPCRSLSRQVRYASHKATLAIRLWTLLTVLCASVAATSVRRGT